MDIKVAAYVMAYLHCNTYNSNCKYNNTLTIRFFFTNRLAYSIPIYKKIYTTKLAKRS